MKIKRVSAQNIKGQSFSHELGDITVFSGKPFHGKTARRDAIVFGLCGYVPWLGKKPSATAKLASASKMSVTLDTDAGSFTREISIRGEKVSLKDCEGMPETPPVLMNMQEYFGLGPTDRAKFIFSRVSLPEDKFSPGALIGSIESIEIDRSSEHERGCLEYLIGEIESSAMAFEEGKSNGDKTTIQEWLDGEIASIKIALKENKDAAKRYTGHNQTSVEMSIRHGESVSRSKVEIEDDIKKCQIKIDSLNQSLAILRDRKIKQFNEKLVRDGLRKVINTHTDDAGLIENLQVDLGGITGLVRPDTSELRDAIATIRSKVYEAKSKIESLRGPIRNSSLEAAERSLGVQRSALGNLSNHRSRIVSAYNENLSKGLCPICGTHGDELTQKLIEKHKLEMGELDSDEQRIKKQIEAQEVVVTQITEHLQKERDSAIESIQKEIAELEDQGRTFKEKFTEKSREEEEYVRKTNQIKDLSAKIESLRKNQSKLIEARTKLDALGVEDYTNYQEELEKVSEELIDAGSKMDDLRDELRSLGAAEAESARAAQTEQEKLRVEANIKVMSLAVDKLLVVQGDLIEASVGSILNIANLFTGGILKGKLHFKDGEIGMIIDGNWVSSDTFSGTEQALAFAGLSVALAAEAPFKIVILDEMGRMDDSTKKLVLTRMDALINNDVISQFICIDVADGAYKKSESVSIINL